MTVVSDFYNVFTLINKYKTWKVNKNNIVEILIFYGKVVHQSASFIYITYFKVNDKHLNKTLVDYNSKSFSLILCGDLNKLVVKFC